MYKENYYGNYNIDYNFQSEGYINIVDDALPEDEETLYIFNGKLYNKNEAGNIIWGGALRQMGFTRLETKAFAQGGTLILGKRFDERNDQKAIIAGWKYQNSLIKVQHQILWRTIDLSSQYNMNW